MKNSASALVFLGVLGVPNLEAVTYQTAHTIERTSDYGDSGTIATGESAGAFTDVSAIITWSIMLNTPGGSDEVTIHILDASNSNLTGAYPEANLSISTAKMEITPTAVRVSRKSPLLIQSNLSEDGQNVVIETVPEPSGAALLALGASAIFFRRRRD